MQQKMDVLATWSGKFILRAAVAEMFITIMGCYLIAVSLGHVQVWLPMISDCAVRPPEMYIFRLGIAIGAFMIGFQAITVYNANKNRPLSKLCAVLALIGSAGLGVVAVVNEKEDDRVHSVCAVAFFICYDIYMLLSVITSIEIKLAPFSCSFHLSWWSFLIKLLLAVIGSIAGIFYVLGKFGLLHLQGGIALAIVEWVNTFMIMGFVWSYLLDEFFENIDLAEVRMTQQNKTSAKGHIDSVPLIAVKEAS